MQFCLDKHGEWVAVSTNSNNKEDEEGGDGFVGKKNEKQLKKIAKTLAETTTWLDMLNDTQRNVKFQRAIENSLESIELERKKNSENENSDYLNVFDVGSGTGLLSLFAARAAVEKTVKIYSCEMYLPVFLVGERVVRDNVREKRIPETRSIKMFHKRSEDVSAIGKHELDLLISELLDSSLLGEGWLLVLQDAFQRELLRKNHFRIVPSKAKISVQLLTASRSVLDVDLMKGRSVLFGDTITSDGYSRLDVQCHFDSLEKRGRIRAISKRIQVFEIDFTSDKNWGRTESVHVSCKSGLSSLDIDEINAVVMFWEIDLDGTGTSFLNTFSRADGNNNQNYRRHWRQVIAPLESPIPLSATKEIPLRIDTRIADDYLAFDVKVSSEGDNTMKLKKRIERHKEIVAKATIQKTLTKQMRLYIALANIPEFWSSRAPLGVDVCGLNLTKANALLCTKSVESNREGYCYQSFKSDLLDELGHRYSMTEEETSMILWETCVPFVNDVDGKEKGEEEVFEEEFKKKKKFHIDVDAGCEITANHVVFLFSENHNCANKWRTQPVSVARMDRQLTGKKFRIIASNFHAEEGECIRVLKK